ncbi:4-hydroxy-tetrahydrodipicolinate reductase [Chlamydia sp.]|uniref:4-hydroxy-tetrahydrodipicolinate reductase n=1 Tax=Chlamydia sp. TaxID=35827 RepID=UPI0025C6F301|nr:4-hydroxy-tetrahydrodipicolinate reductase [Chlamydia sp.]MBQ8498234.1 4-hydroxy-tetrahydrodipicolinate reductase [Chlamydia sp.]
MKSIGLIGNTGRMGALLTQALLSHPRCFLGKGFSRRSQTSLDEVVSGNDILIDFSAPEITTALLDLLLMMPRPVIIGTTGFSADSDVSEKMIALSEKVPVVICPNASLGAYVQKRLTAFAAKIFDASYDVRILETHHRTKADAISGTALSLAETVRSAKKERVEKDGQPAIEIYGSRVGSIFGEHEVSFVGEHERFVIRHEAFSRQIFSKGVLLILEKILEGALAAGRYTSDILYKDLVGNGF